MIIFFRNIFFVLISFLYVMNAQANGIDPTKLIKVTKDNDPRCIEYYAYNQAIYCSSEKLSDETVNPRLREYEKLNIIFDSRPWRIAWGNQDSNGTTIEYVTNGEQIATWNELITSQFFPGIQDKATIKEFVNSFIDNLKKSTLTPRIIFHETANEHVIFEIQIQQPQNLVQDILELVMANNQGIYVLQYAVKKSDMGEETRKHWIENFKNTTIKA